MDTRRVILFAAFALIIYSLYSRWLEDYPPVTHTVAAAESAPSEQALLPGGLGSTTPAAAHNGNQSPVLKTSMPETSGKTIQVKTDVLNVQIDLNHGDITGAFLTDYPVSSEAKDKPFPLLYSAANSKYIARSNLVVSDGQTVEPLSVSYSSAREIWTLNEGENTLKVVLEGQSADGLRVEKSFVFERGSYLVNVQYNIENQGDNAWQGYFNTQLLRSSPTEDSSSMFHVGSYTGGSYSNPGKRNYQKVSFKDMEKSNLDVDVAKGGWIAMQQHYFLTAWVAPADAESRFYTRAKGDDYTIGAVSSPIKLQPRQSIEVSSRLYAGPEITSTLKAIAPGLDLTVDYGWLWFLSSILFSVMKAIHSVVGNWGWAIVLVTLLVKAAFYRLSATSYKSMAGMRKLQPKLQALRERFGDDKAKLSQATMELYRAEKINPLGGCLPVVIQIPVFIALYWVLLESVELRQAPFILWIQDLAAPDPWHILPVIMGATMLIQQRLNPAPPDPMQAKVMMFLPVLFTALFWNFPSGLVLYWIVNNTLSILQQWYITRKYSDDKPVPAGQTAR
ncbi:preprotein translocase subunit YidC [Legionella geestiana]|uniref:Membrane protein insertase YidC n=1 Tax=Legionella geestiana TaxID=45065 RepID=A0A0W0TZC9_9GAMM|nr:membrane protein insertase YidC [Legionella geestiana]KTD01202.1 preprotein translocase subunit YidC [Legionella geestiana]QBS12323.1 membrane protein insertase YidC [Legionella geestiana]QDQ39963.1 membrane protein insertase YidC [Legionella geestiana]STX55243.1 preprotein translocase YidC subunit [Legionella geestiana]